MIKSRARLSTNFIKVQVLLTMVSRVVNIFDMGCIRVMLHFEIKHRTSGKRGEISWHTMVKQGNILYSAFRLCKGFVGN